MNDLQPGDIVTLAEPYSNVICTFGWRATVIEAGEQDTLLLGFDRNQRPWQRRFPTSILEKVKDKS
jgi:hypothetical protein